MISNTTLCDQHNHINFTANKSSGMSSLSATLHVIFETFQMQIKRFHSNIVVHI